MNESGRREVDIIVPQVGEAIAEATLLRWLKREGEPVKRGDILFELDLDKSTVEVEAFESGILASILVPADSSVVPLEKVGVLLLVGDDAPPSRSVARSIELEGGGPSSAPKEPMAPEPQQHEPDALATSASPLARRRAKELGLALDDVIPIGGGNMIGVADVERTARLRTAMPVEHGPHSDVLDDPETPSRAPLARVRAAVAMRMVRSKQSVPHFYLLADVDMSEVVGLRERLGTLARAPTITTFLVAATARALKANPEFNAWYVDGDIARHDRVSIGVAVATAGGLLLPVIIDADTLDLGQLDAAIREGAERARQGRMRASDLTPRSLVISNLGMLGVDAFLAIIDEPDPFILAAGRIRDAVVPIGGIPAVRPIATLSLSVDHRAFDGAEAARFFGEIIRRLEAGPPDGDDQ